MFLAFIVGQKWVKSLLLYGDLCFSGTVTLSLYGYEAFLNSLYHIVTLGSLEGLHFDLCTRFIGKGEAGDLFLICFLCLEGGL